MRTNRTLKKRGHRPQRFTEEHVAQAVTEAKGILTIAAQNLGCSKSTVYEYLERYPSLKGVLSDARESAIDFAESALFKAIEGGNVTAMIFYLKTQAKHRGYSERPENDPETDFAFTINIGDRGHGNTG